MLVFYLIFFQNYQYYTVFTNYSKVFVIIDSCRFCRIIDSFVCVYSKADSNGNGIFYYRIEYNNCWKRPGAIAVHNYYFRYVAHIHYRKCQALYYSLKLQTCRGGIRTNEFVLPGEAMEIARRMIIASVIKNIGDPERMYTSCLIGIVCDQIVIYEHATYMCTHRRT